MKKIINTCKTTILSVGIALIMTFTACSNGNNPSNSTFPNIDDADIPDVLEITVGTCGDGCPARAERLILRAFAGLFGEKRVVFL